MMHRILFVFIALFFSWTSFARETYLIGFSQCSGGEWRENMEAEMARELMFHDDLELITKYAGDSSLLQVEQIREFIKYGIDLLIVAPNEITPVQPIIEEVYQMGIPVVLIDRKIGSDQYTAYVGGDNNEIGNTAGTYIADKLNQEGEVVELLGTLSSSPALERMLGFESALEKYSKLKIVDRLYTKWNIQYVLDNLPLVLKKYPGIKAVFAHADFLAAAANQVLKDHFPDRNVLIVGVDGLPNKGGGIQLVEDKIITATLIYPTGGKSAIQVAASILNSRPFQKNNILPTTLIDDQNVKVTQLQYKNIEALQRDISRSKDMLDLLGGRYRTQQLLLFIALFSLLIIIFLTVLLFRAFEHKKLANLNLQKQKEAISFQNKELKRVSDQLEEATQARLRFYTNISHEFRTPLTLIVGPLENMMQSNEVSEKFKRNFQLMHRNTLRLSRLINQLMDFRKIESNKMKLKAGRYNLVEFLKGVYDSFAELTKQKGIDMQVIYDEQEILMWFDWDKLDKVMFNLLSNALKHTPTGGKIHISVKRVESVLETAGKEDICIEVRDNGVGISGTDLEKIFDRYYQAEESNSLIGTGIGLSLSKELILLHKGSISVESKVGLGTAFKIYLPLGNSHLKEEEMTVDQKEQFYSAEPIFSELGEIEEKKSIQPNEIPLVGEEKPLILIVEDQADVRDYIRSCFDGSSYAIIEAENGSDGLIAVEKEEPDIIISDVMMPVMDGLKLTKHIKTSIKYCHIPIILLTAKSSLEHMLEGLEEGADCYISKPFNQRHLQMRVRKLLETRNRIREKYRDSIQLHVEEKGLNRMDKDFLSKLTSLINENQNQEKINIEEISRKMGLSRVHLYRKVKKLTGMTVSEFVKTIKLKISLDLLKNSGMTVAEIAYEVGFSTSSYYTKCFKEQFNMSPTEFRQMK